MFMPGQILLPAPNTKWSRWEMSGFTAASEDVCESLMKRVGSNSDGLGYRTGFCWIVLRSYLSVLRRLMVDANP